MWREYQCAHKYKTTRCMLYLIERETSCCGDRWVCSKEHLKAAYTLVLVLSCRLSVLSCGCGFAWLSDLLELIKWRVYAIRRILTCLS